ncbi:MAG: hypothetical protein J6J36_07050 [Clostridia bacterium]|nr:hypothetical protein [Clostridia bacterium]
MKYELMPCTPKVTLKEVSQYGEVMEVGNFLQLCIGGYFTDYDGYGRFIVKVDGQEYEITDISFDIANDVVEYSDYEASIFWFCNNFGIKKIIWFNK